MPLSSELQEALARSRRRPGLRHRSVDFPDGTRAPSLEHNDTVPADDPDNDPYPADSPMLSLPAPLPAEMPATWWEVLLFGKPGDAVLPQDARLALALIEARLGEYEE
jgi:hypothetical protein